MHLSPEDEVPNIELERKKAEFLVKLEDVRQKITLRDTTLGRFYRGFKNFNICTDAEGRYIGYVEIILCSDSTLFKRAMEIKYPGLRGKGYGKSVYKYLQATYLDYIVVSDPETMTFKTDMAQQKSDAVYMWDSLVKEGWTIKLADKVYRFDNPFVMGNS